MFFCKFAPRKGKFFFINSFQFKNKFSYLQALTFVILELLRNANSQCIDYTGCFFALNKVIPLLR